MAQLPALSDSSQQLPITEEYFKELCSRFMDKKNLSVLDGITLEPSYYLEKTGCYLLDTWYDYERKLRIALGQLRGLRMKKAFVGNDIVVDSDIMQSARTAMGFDSPLEAEQYINSLRLAKINSLWPSDNFSTEAVFAYGLKLKLLNRIARFNEEKGMASYRKIYDRILGDQK